MTHYEPIVHDERTMNMRSGGAKMKPATYDGNASWPDYKAHFDACAEINGWNDREKGLYLAVSLRGQAQGVFGNLSIRSNDYHLLVTALEERFSPPNQTELYRVQLRERRQKATEVLPELGQDIRRLTNLAYPTAPADVRETLAKEQFIDSLANVDMRIRIKQARPTDLNDAVRHAVELEAYNKAERQKMEGHGYMCNAQMSEKPDDCMKILKQFMQEMRNELRTLKSQRNSKTDPWVRQPKEQSIHPRSNKGKKCFE